MKNLTIFLLILTPFVFTNCATQKRCQRKFPPQIETRDSIVYRDSIVLKPVIIRDTIPGDTVTVEVEIQVPPGPCPDPEKITSREAKAETQYAVARAWLQFGKVNLELRQKEQVIERIIADAQKEAYYWREKYQEKKEVQVVKFIPKFYTFTLWFFIAVCGLTIGRVMWVVRRGR